MKIIYQNKKGENFFISILNYKNLIKSKLLFTF